MKQWKQRQKVHYSLVWLELIGAYKKLLREEGGRGIINEIWHLQKLLEATKLSPNYINVYPGALTEQRGRVEICRLKDHIWKSVGLSELLFGLQSEAVWSVYYVNTSVTLGASWVVFNLPENLFFLNSLFVSKWSNFRIHSSFLGNFGQYFSKTKLWIFVIVAVLNLPENHYFSLRANKRINSNAEEDLREWALTVLVTASIYDTKYLSSSRMVCQHYLFMMISANTIKTIREAAGIHTQQGYILSLFILTNLNSRNSKRYTVLLLLLL